MDTQILEAIRGAVRQEMDFHVALVAILCVLAFAIGAFGKSFLSKSGEHAARRQYAEEIKKLDSEHAHAIETVKLDIARVQDLLRQQLSMQNFAFQKYVDALSELARLVSAGSHAICWVSWVAKQNQAALSDVQMQAYEVEINGVLGKLVGARVALAALNPAAHEALAAHIEKLYELDIEAGLARAKFSQSRLDGVDAWAALYDMTWEFDRSFLRAVILLAVDQPRSRGDA